MNIVEQIIALLRKDILLEWRQGYALSGILLYVLCTVMTAYLAFHKAEPVVWLTLFWVILLFASVNAVAKVLYRKVQAGNCIITVWLARRRLLFPK